MSVKKNVIANYLGQGWAGFIGLALVPLYIRYLGVEAYGLIGIFALLQAWLLLLDMGMAPTLNREAARFTGGAHTVQSIHDLLRSVEIIAFGIALSGGLLIWLVSDWVAADWLRVEKLPVQVVAQAISIMGIVASLRLVEGIYRGAILGLQRQVFFNVVNATSATVRAIGAVLVLAWISPTIEAYFIWQGIVSIVSVVVLAVAARKSLPVAPRPPRFSHEALYEIRHFVGGLMASTVLAFLLTQVDKILLSRLLGLEQFGYYTFAATVATVITLSITPISQAFYPRFSELIALGDKNGLVRAYHRSAQLVSVLAIPLAFMLMLFGERILLLWSGDPSLTQHTALLLSLLAVGTLLNALMYIPYMLQLAHGWSSFAAKVNLIAVLVLVPAIIWATPRYGAIGAATAWVTLNAGYVLVGIHFMHKRLLPTEKLRWFTSDVLFPILAVGSTAGVLYAFQPLKLGKVGEVLWLCITTCALIGIALFTTPALKTLAVNSIAGCFSRRA